MVMIATGWRLLSLTVIRVTGIKPETAGLIVLGRNTKIHWDFAVLQYTKKSRKSKLEVNIAGKNNQISADVHTCNTIQNCFPRLKIEAIFYIFSAHNNSYFLLFHAT